MPKRAAFNKAVFSRDKGSWVEAEPSFGILSGEACIIHKEPIPSRRGSGLTNTLGFKASHRVIGKALSGTVFPRQWQASLLVKYLEANVFALHPEARKYWAEGDEKLLFYVCDRAALAGLSHRISFQLLEGATEKELYNKFWPGSNIPF